MKRYLLIAAIFMTTTLSSAFPADSNARPAPPVAKKIPKTEVVHGITRTDDYFWLRNKPDPEVRAYLEAENSYADAILKPTETLQQELYQEMVGHMKETDATAPFPEGEYLYYTRTETGKQYPIYCRKKGEKGAEEVILDVNKLAEGQQFMHVSDLEVSDDGNLLAYTTDNTGFRQYTLQVKNLKTGEVYPERMEKVGSVAWAADNKTLFYTVEEEQTKRQYRMYRHMLGSDAAKDPVAFEEPDERFNIGVGRTRSRDYLILEDSSHTTADARVLRADQPNGEWTLIAPRIQDQQYFVDQRGDQFYIRVDDTGRNFRLVTAPIATPGREHWKELVAHRADVMLANVELFQDFYVLVEREKGLPQFRIVDFSTGNSHLMNFPEPTYSASPAQNRVFNTDRFRYNYQSMVVPSSVYDYDINKRTSTLLKRVEVPGYDPQNYESERLFATAPDGTKVPISIVYRRGFKRDGSHPHAAHRLRRIWPHGAGDF